MFQFKDIVMNAETEFLSDLNEDYKLFSYRYLLFRLLKLLIIAAGIFIMFYAH